MKWVIWLYSGWRQRWMKSEEYIELQTLRTKQTTTISCQLKRIWRRSTLIQRWWKWIRRLLESHQWLLWTLFKQVKIAIDSRKIDWTAVMRTLLDEERR